MKQFFTIYSLVITLFFSACGGDITVSRTIDTTPGIYPDYTGVTIPPNIAPLNFGLDSSFTKAAVIVEAGDIRDICHYRKGQFTFSGSDWKNWLTAAKGDSIRFTVCTEQDGEWVGFKPFGMYVAEDPVDPYVAYRLIEPGYILWNKMGIYQRHLESYDESPIMENKMSGQNCMNCHSFPDRNPEKMLFHMRGNLASTVLVDGNRVEKLNTKTDQTISALVYPSWHPSEKYIAFSVNDTKQSFHTKDKNLVEVYDMKSDVVVYDVEKHEIFSDSRLMSGNAFENFPAFSPDGKKLYFCSAAFRTMADEYDDVKYSLCSVDFDPVSRKFGEKVDTLFNARTENRSVSFPRVSPDGNFLLYGKADYGGFFVWHKEADLYMMDINTGEHYALDGANSPDVESYHSWSGNSRWIIYISRRLDGLYSRLYICYIDPYGKAGKAFLMPQKDIRFYDDFMKSYNVPEFVSGKVGNLGYTVSSHVKADPGINVTFHQ